MLMYRRMHWIGQLYQKEGERGGEALWELCPSLGGRVWDFRTQLSLGIAPILLAREFNHRDNIRPPRQGPDRAVSISVMQAVCAQDPAASIPANSWQVHWSAVLILHFSFGWKTETGKKKRSLLNVRTVERKWGINGIGNLQCLRVTLWKS